VLPVSTGFLKLADLLTLAAVPAPTSPDAAVVLTLMEAVLFTDGRDGSFSVVFWRRVRGGGFGTASESADDSRLRKEGDLSVGRRGTVLLGRLPLLLDGDGLREAMFNFSPMCDNQDLVGARKPPLAPPSEAFTLRLSLPESVPSTLFLFASLEDIEEAVLSTEFFLC
jgi:hypothetical protein